MVRFTWMGGIALLAAVGSTSQAQIMLPGALPPGAAATPGQPAPALPNVNTRPSLPPASRAPAEEGIFGRQFQRNGRSGVIVFERTSGKPPAISKLALVGYQVSKPAEACRVEISGGHINVRPVPRHEGLLTYEVAMEACPFSFDVLEGAIRVRGGICEIVAADCRIDPGGLWGPAGTSIGADEIKNSEALRTRADTESRADYRALVALAGSDRKKLRDLAHDQAGFSSLREEACRDYQDEDRHGYCGARISQAHAVSLSAQLYSTSGKPAAAKPPARPAPKAKPIAPATLPQTIQ